MGRILVISDIHGMYEEFEKLINGINYDPDTDQLVLLGDYVDRGPEPIKCLERVIELTQVGAIALMGNHEAMCLEVVRELEDGSLKLEDLKDDPNGTYETVRKIVFGSPAEDIDRYLSFLSGLPDKHRIGKYIFAHAGYNPAVPFEKQNKFSLMWSREDFFRHKMPDDICVIFGHTPTQHLGCDATIYHGVNRIGVDCGAVFGGNLACLAIDTDDNKPGTEYYVKCERKWSTSKE